MPNPTATKLPLTDLAKARLAEVAAWLEAGAPHTIRQGVHVGGFDMDVGITDPRADCGSVCCIAGALVQFNQPFSATDDHGYEEVRWDQVRTRAVHLLGMPDDPESWRITERLFRSFPDNEWITPAIAARVLRHLIATGEVDWGPDSEGDQP